MRGVCIRRRRRVSCEASLPLVSNKSLIFSSVNCMADIEQRPAEGLNHKQTSEDISTPDKTLEDMILIWLLPSEVRRGPRGAGGDLAAPSA